MALYLDTSCLLKVFFPEPETDRTLFLIAAEARVLVSSLARLESRPADVIDIAVDQIDVAARGSYCRPLDRLHLATMQALGVHRLLTNDDTQAAAARAQGLEVVLPR